MSTLRLLFAGSSEPGGLSPMPSLGRTFGGNGDFIGAWFKNSAQPPMFETAPVLGRFKVDGQDIPFTGMWALAGIDTAAAGARLEKETGEDNSTHWNGSGHGSGIGKVRKGARGSGLRRKTTADLRRRYGGLSARWRPKAA